MEKQEEPKHKTVLLSHSPIIPEFSIGFAYSLLLQSGKYPGKQILNAIRDISII